MKKQKEEHRPGEINIHIDKWTFTIILVGVLVVGGIFLIPVASDPFSFISGVTSEDIYLETGCDGDGSTHDIGKMRIKLGCGSRRWVQINDLQGKSYRCSFSEALTGAGKLLESFHKERRK